MIRSVAKLLRATAQHPVKRRRVHQPFDSGFRACAADPRDIEAKGLGAGDIEAVRRHKQDIPPPDVECLLDKRIAGWVRLVYASCVDTDCGFDPPLQS